MKKTGYIFCFIFILSVLPAFGLDFGGILNNNTSYEKGSTPLFNQQNSLYAWLNTGIGDKVQFNIKGSGIFSIKDPLYIFNLDSLYLKGEFPVIKTNPFMFSFSAGRFLFSDFTGNVLSHTADGLKIGFTLPFADFSLYAGYTGLLFRQSSSIILTKADITDRNNSAIITGSPRLVTGLAVNLPEIVFSQDIDLSVLMQWDLRAADTLISEGDEDYSSDNGGRLNTQFFGLGISGPVIPSLYYSTFFYLETGKTLSYTEDTASSTDYSYSQANILSYIAGGDIRYYIENFLFSKIGVDILFSSGDADIISFIEGNHAGALTLFVPVSNSGKGLLFRPMPGNIFQTELSYSLKPFSKTDIPTLDSFQTLLKTTVSLRPTPGLISKQGIDPDSTGAYLGTEIALVNNYMPFSDLGVSLSGSIFIPNPAVFTEEYNSLWYLGKLEFSFSF